MIRLTISAGNRHLDLPNDVRLEVRPRVSGLDAASTSEATRRVAVLQREVDAEAAAGQPADPTGFNAANEAALNGLFWQFQTEAMLRFALVSWEGVGDADGNALPVTPENCAAFAAVPTLAGAFRAAYDEDILIQAAEGNASTPSSGGATGQAASTALDASSDGEGPASPTAPSADPAPPS